VCDADIKGGITHISHEALLRKLHTYPQLRRLIKGWLQAGVMEGMDFSPTESGTPQGGVISPLLMNVALHGMEQAMAEARYQYGKPGLVRYADDFVLFHPDKEELQVAVEQVTSWKAGHGTPLASDENKDHPHARPLRGERGF
jgi:RNA-directed DNA polymerase